MRRDSSRSQNCAPEILQSGLVDDLPHFEGQSSGKLAIVQELRSKKQLEEVGWFNQAGCSASLLMAEVERGEVDCFEKDEQVAVFGGCLTLSMTGHLPPELCTFLFLSWGDALRWELC